MLNHSVHVVPADLDAGDPYVLASSDTSAGLAAGTLFNVGANQVSTVVALNAAGMVGLNDTYFTIEGYTTKIEQKDKLFVWINYNDTGTVPTVAGYTAVEWAIAVGSTAAENATALATAMAAVLSERDGLALFTAATGGGSTCTITATHVGRVAHINDLGSTTLTLAVTTRGQKPSYLKAVRIYVEDEPIRISFNRKDAVADGAGEMGEPISKDFLLVINGYSNLEGLRVISKVAGAHAQLMITPYYEIE